MKLKNKIALTIVLIMACATLIYWGVFRAVILTSFEDVESESAQKSILRCVAAIDGETRHLERVAMDWASWDDTYEFARTHYPGFIEKNLVDGTFKELQIDLIHIYDTRGNLLWGKTLDTSSERVVPLDLSMELKPGIFSRLVYLRDTKTSTSGVIQTRFGPMILASGPILTSEDKGPSRGTLLMGRFIRGSILSGISRQEDMGIRIWPINAGSNPGWSSSILRVLSRVNPVTFSNDPDVIHGYTFIRDISGQPAILLEASIPRTIMKQKIQAYHTGIFLIIGAGFVILAAISGMIRIMVLEPISTLTKNVLTVRASTPNTRPFETGRKDEIGTLSREFAAMIKRISGSEEVFRFLAENARDAIWMVDLDLSFTYMSPAVEKIRGVKAEEALGESLEDIMTAESYAKLMKIYNKDLLKRLGKNRCVNLDATVDLELYRKDGSTVWTEITMNALYDGNDGVAGIMGIARDISERKRVEEEKKKLDERLIQNQKMEALGRFAGGITHDMNNILYPLIINSELLVQGYEPGTEKYQIANQILSSAYRQRNLVKQILSFSRKSDQKLGPIKITPVVRETLGFLRSSLPSSIRITQRLNAEDDTIVGDSTQIQQVIMNLCRNAADAMECQTGVIEVVLENAYLEPAHAGTGMRPGRYVVLAVNDNGSGIPPDVMNRIFEPFFTTKGAGKGSGMGLAVVHGIVTGLGGGVSVENEPGKGSRFSVYLPLHGVEGLSQATLKESPAPAPGESSDGTRRRILLVDDEEPILVSLKRMLQRSGYDVTTTTDGTEALALFAKDPRRFDLVITDQTMPQISGSELAAKIMEIRSDIPIVISTGFPEIIDEEEMKAMGIRDILIKPLSSGELLSVIGKALHVGQDHPAPAAQRSRNVSRS